MTAAFDRLPAVMMISASTPPTTIPTGPVHSMPSNRPTTATMTDMTIVAPGFGTRAARYIHTMPPGIAPMACVNQNVFAFMPRIIANAKNTMKRRSPKIAMKMKSLPWSFALPWADTVVTM